MKYVKFSFALLAAMSLAFTAMAAQSSKSKGKMTDEQVRAKCINDFQKTTGSTGPQTAADVTGNNSKYMACVQKYGVRP
jgi:hypothetical protein